MTETEKNGPEKKTSSSAQSRSTAAKSRSAASENAPREELNGVLRTSRVGVIEDSRERLTDPEGERHKVLSEASKPGDEDYNPYTDPLIPTSTLQQTVAKELEGLGKSPTWDALKEAEDRMAKRYDTLREFNESEYAEAS
jgi:hypothetical protein